MEELARTLLPIHIATGALALIFGGVALAVRKGGTVHRRSGMLFVWMMVVMGATASLLGLRNGLTDPNVFAVFLTGYFAITALTTVRPATPWTRRLDVTALIVVVLLALGTTVGGIESINSPDLSSGGVPRRTIGVMSLILAALMLLAAAGDVRILRFGAPRGGKRLARHLWRMCLALLIAAGSFFSIRERVAAVLPEPFATGPVRALPILLIFAAMLFWLWRVRRPGLSRSVMRSG